MCPDCGRPMKYRDSCKRNEKKAGGDRQNYWISRYSCKWCKRTLRGLPDVLAPYKHYNVDIIMGVLDGEISPDDPEYEDYPCEKTMQRWKKWFEQNEATIAEYLLICGARLLAYGLVVLYEYAACLKDIREKQTRWLSIILRIIYDTGAVLEPLREDSS